jgi:hypothetical protein
MTTAIRERCIQERSAGERSGTGRPTNERATWACDNCSGQTAAPRKRCSDCGTSRY